MGKGVVRYLLLSQLGFFGFLGVCLAIVPRYVYERNEGGVSNYGVNPATTVPFTFAFLLSALFIVKAGQLTPDSPRRLQHFRRALLTLGALLVLVLVSTYPYKVNVVLKDMHIVCGALLISIEMVITLWLASRLRWSWNRIVLVVVQASGCVLALVTLLGALHVLLLAQLIASGAFGISLVWFGRQLLQQDLFGMHHQ